MTCHTHNTIYEYLWTYMFGCVFHDSPFLEISIGRCLAVSSARSTTSHQSCSLMTSKHGPIPNCAVEKTTGYGGLDLHTQFTGFFQSRNLLRSVLEHTEYGRIDSFFFLNGHRTLPENWILNWMFQTSNSIFWIENGPSSVMICLNIYIYIYIIYI